MTKGQVERKKFGKHTFTRKRIVHAQVFPKYLPYHFRKQFGEIVAAQKKTKRTLSETQTFALETRETVSSRETFCYAGKACVKFLLVDACGKGIPIGTECIFADATEYQKKYQRRCYYCSQECAEQNFPIRNLTLFISPIIRRHGPVAPSTSALLRDEAAGVQENASTLVQLAEVAQEESSSDTVPDEF